MMRLSQSLPGGATSNYPEPQGPRRCCMSSQVVHKAERVPARSSLKPRVHEVRRSVMGFLAAASVLALLPTGLGPCRAFAGGAEGGVIAWGLNTIGQATVPPEAQEGVTAIAAGAFHSLALKNGQVIAWGQNSDGQTDVPEEAKSGVTA